MFPCSQSTDTISPSVELHKHFFNMVAMNYALVEKDGVILQVGSLNRTLLGLYTSQREIVCELDFNQWVGSTLPFLLNAHHLIGAYFLTTEGDKRMRLLTRLYSILANVMPFSRVLIYVLLMLLYIAQGVREWDELTPFTPA